MKNGDLIIDLASGVAVRDYSLDFYERRERIKQEKIFFKKPKGLYYIKGE